jgi:hypothetical protein
MFNLEGLPGRIKGPGVRQAWAVVARAPFFSCKSRLFDTVGFRL